MSQGETREALLTNIQEAIEECLSVDLENISQQEGSEVIELAV